MNYILKFLIILSTIFSISKTVLSEELIIWSRGGWSDWMVEGFNKKMADDGKDIVALNNLIGHADFQVKFTAALAAGERVDVANIDLINVPYYAEIGALEDMTDFLKSKDYYDKLLKGMLALGTNNGRHFAAPNAADVSGYAVNKKLIPNPPTNWAEMTELCKQFAADGKILIAWPGNNYGGQIFTVMPVAWANGGSWTSFDGSKAELNHPKTIEMYEHYQNMINIGCVPKNVSSWGWGDKQDGFLAGDIGMIGTGNFMINVVKDHLDKVDPHFMPFMSKDGSTKSAFIGGDLIAIPVTTGNKEAALEYIEYVLSYEGQVEVYTKNGGIPIRSDLFEGNPYLTDQHMVFANAVNEPEAEAPFTYVYQELMDPWLVFNQRIWNGEDVKTVADEQTAAMQKIIDSGY